MRSLYYLHGGVEEGAVHRIQHDRSSRQPSRRIWAVLDGSTSSVGRLPPLYRIDYWIMLERWHARSQAPHPGRRVYGPDLMLSVCAANACPTRPILPKISAYLRADPFRNWSQQVQGLSALSRVDSRRSQTLLRAVLYSGSFF
jgi:hypothetical protein